MSLSFRLSQLGPSRLVTVYRPEQVWSLGSARPFSDPARSLTLLRLPGAPPSAPTPPAEPLSPQCSGGLGASPSLTRAKGSLPGPPRSSPHFPPLLIAQKGSEIWVLPAADTGTGAKH